LSVSQGILKPGSTVRDVHVTFENMELGAFADQFQITGFFLAAYFFLCLLAHDPVVDSGE